MNTLILYASKSGTTEKCSQLLANKLENTYIMNLEKETPSTLDYDTIIIGGSIHYGTLNKAVTTFIKKNLDTLLTKKIGLFLCCGLKNEVEKHFLTNFPKALLDIAVDIEYFGGEFQPESLSGLDKVIGNIIRLTNKDLKEHPPEIITANIDRMARNVNQLA